MPTSKSSKKDRVARVESDLPATSKPTRKRKVDPNLPKFYAVRSGNKPGVYLTWSECQEQTSGCRGASYKSFTSREDAEAYVAGKKTSGTADSEVKFYAVAVGREPGIYTDWDEASVAIKGWKAPKYKKFETYEAAIEFIRAHGNEAGQAWLSKELAALQSKKAKLSDEPKRKKARVDDEPKGKKIIVEEEDGPESKEAEPDDEDDDEDEDEDESELLEIFTDGSSLANGRAGAAAGVGVFFGEGDERNVSERLQGETQTNQRAELTAVIRALELTKDDENIRICTDSRYTIECATNWYRNWVKNDWKKPNGDSVLNQDLVKEIRALIDERDEAGFKTGFQWVKGHSTSIGNAAADRLAVAGARMRT